MQKKNIPKTLGAGCVSTHVVGERDWKREDINSLQREQSIMDGRHGIRFVGIDLLVFILLVDVHDASRIAQRVLVSNSSLLVYLIPWV